MPAANSGASAEPAATSAASWATCSGTLAVQSSPLSCMQQLVMVWHASRPLRLPLGAPALCTVPLTACGRSPSTACKAAVAPHRAVDVVLRQDLEAPAAQPHHQRCASVDPAINEGRGVAGRQAQQQRACNVWHGRGAWRDQNCTGDSCSIESCCLLAIAGRSLLAFTGRCLPVTAAHRSSVGP